MNLNEINLDFSGITNKILGYMREENITIERVEEIDSNMIILANVLIKSFSLDDPVDFKNNNNDEKLLFASIEI